MFGGQLDRQMNRQEDKQSEKTHGPSERQKGRLLYKRLKEGQAEVRPIGRKKEIDKKKDKHKERS